MELIKPLSKIRKNNVSIAGGKGASLGEMLNAGIPVPNGFVILSTAFDRFIEETDLDVELDAILDKVDYQEIHTVENASEEIKSLIVNAKMPEDIAKDVELNFKKLGAKFVAVRSSATSEDSSTAAWAGQLESYLNTTEKDLLENVKKCWASLFTPRAIFYRKEKNLHKSKISVAVVVQKMVDSECSGIAFSVHPVTQDENQIIIEAGFGLGEAIVSGQITPDSYVIEKKPRRIIDKNLIVQERALYRSPKGGNEWKTLPKEIREKQKLSDKEILELAELILKIEKHYGFPCDIEWAKEKGRFYIVQSRPITTLGKKKEKNKNWDRESLTAVFINNVNKRKAELWPPLHNFSVFIQGSGWNRKEFFKKYYRSPLDNDVIILQNQKKSFQLVYADLLKRPAEEFFLDYLKKKSILKKRKEIMLSKINLMDRLYKEHTYEKINRLHPERLLSLAKKVIRIIWGANAAVFFAMYFDKEMCLKILNKEGYVINSFDKLWEESTKPTFPYFDAEAFLDYKKTKDPEYLQYIFTTYFKVFDLDYVQKNMGKKFSGFKEEVFEIIEKDKKSFKEFKKSLSNRERLIAEYIQDIIFLRDKRKNFFNKGLTLIWRIAERFFVEEEIPKELIPYTLMQELFRGKKYLKSIEDKLLKRKDGFTVLVPWDNQPKVEYGDIEEGIKILDNFFKKGNVPSPDMIKGQAAFKGFVRGRAKIIKRIDGIEDFEEGDILVAGMTRPEYVPLMRKASAIITDEGGITCHAAIVSRELKKPCIIGTKIATSFLNSGDLIEVDAYQGTIKIIKRAKND